MKEFYQCKTSFEGLDDNGNEKTMKEVCLINAISYTDAEAFANKEYAELLNSGELNIDDLKKVKIADVIRDEISDYIWYKVTISYTEEKKSNSAIVMVQADEFKSVYGIIETYEKETMMLWEVVKIEKSPVIEIHLCDTDYTGKLEID